MQIFYWGWWIAWAPFVGMFIAKISRGRTVRNIINGAMTGPVLYRCFYLLLQSLHCIDVAAALYAGRCWRSLQ